MPQVFRERRLAGAEEPGNPYADPLVWIGEAVAVFPQELFVAALNRVCRDVLLNFAPDSVVLLLIELDHFFNSTVEPIGVEKVANCLHRFFLDVSYELGYLRPDTCSYAASRSGSTSLI